MKGIVINAFTEPFIVPVELFDTIANMPSVVEEEEKGYSSEPYKD